MINLFFYANKSREDLLEEKEKRKEREKNGRERKFMKKMMQMLGEKSAE